MTQALVMFCVVIFLVTNFVVDVLYATRIRASAIAKRGEEIMVTADTAIENNKLPDQKTFCHIKRLARQQPLGTAGTLVVI